MRRERHRDPKYESCVAAPLRQEALHRNSTHEALVRGGDKLPTEEKGRGDILTDALVARSVSGTISLQLRHNIENADPTKLRARTALHPDYSQDVRHRGSAERAINQAGSRKREGGRRQQIFGLDRPDQTGGKKLGERMVAWRSAQIAFEGKVKMGRKEEIAAGRQIEEDVIVTDPTMVKAWAQVR